MEESEHHEDAEEVSIGSRMSALERRREHSEVDEGDERGAARPAAAPRPGRAAPWRATIHHQTGGVARTIASKGTIAA